jgi:hypothetical protein
MKRIWMGLTSRPEGRLLRWAIAYAIGLPLTLVVWNYFDIEHQNFLGELIFWAAFIPVSFLVLLWIFLGKQLPN